MAQFTAGSIVVYRVGTGAAALSSAATAVFLDEYSPTGTLIQSIALPTIDNGLNQTLTAAGSSTTEGLLTRSTNGQYLVLTGYDAAAGTAAVAGTATTAVTRVIGRVAVDGTIDTTTTTTNYSGANIRGAVSTDGTQFWETGSSGGLFYQAFGTTGAGTSIAAAPANDRAVNIFDGQLYITSGSSPFVGVSSIGVGTPTMSGQTATLLTGANSTNPYQFFFADLSATVAGVDTLYVADSTGTNGLEKFSLVGGVWTLNNKITTPTGMIGLTGSVSGGNVSLYITTSSTLFALTDTSGYNAADNGTATVVANAAANTGFRGVALAPVAAGPSTGAFAIAPVVASIAEGNTGIAPATAVSFTVSRTGGTGDSTVSYSIGGGVNAADIQGGLLTGTVAFTGAETSKTVTVNVIGDTTLEADEALTVTLTGATGGTLAATPSATTTILNDDAAPAGGVIAFAAAAASVAEGAANTTTPISFTVQRTGGSSGTVTADYAVTFTGTNPANAADFVAGQPLTGTVSFADGETSKLVTLTVQGDAAFEPNETFTVTLSNATGGASLSTTAPTSAIGTILNDDFTPIYTIQGSAATQGANGASPFVGQSVTTQGVVTAVDTNGYYIQDVSGDGNTGTSDAILVFTSSAPGAGIVVGALVQVTGTIVEFASTANGAGAPTVTEITNSTASIVTPNGVALPAPVVITAVPNDLAGALAFFESLEGMRVTVPTPLVTGPTTTSGEIFTVANGGIGSGVTPRGNLLLTAGADSFGNTNTVGGDFQPDRLVITSGLGTSVPNTLNVGAVLNDVTGILGQGFGYPEIQATQAVTVQTNSPLTKTGTSLTGAGNQLLFASYNAENLDPTDGAARFTTVANEIINQLHAPGIIAMQEIQDNDGPGNAATSTVTSASTTLQMLVNAITAAGGPTYAIVDNTFITDDRNGGEPGGNIRVAYLYRTDTVSLVPGSLRTIAANGSAIADTGTAAGNAAANSDQATNTNNPFNGSRPPLAADFTLLANNETFTVVNNHFTSKGGSAFTTGTTQPPLNAGEVARAAQAQAVNTFVDGILSTNPNARVIVTGDLNDYEFEEPLKVLKGTATVTNYNGTGQGTATYVAGGTAVLTDLQDQLPTNQRYDYVFDGVSQTLDHMLATGALVNAGITFQPVHINAEFYNQTSDHDPLTALFTIADTTAPLLTQTTPLDNATLVAPSANIVLTFNEVVKAGTGNIILRPGTGADVVIAVTDTTQVSFTGSTATINPAADLRPNVAYDVIIGSGVITDTAGNAFAGIALDALDFTTSTSAVIPAGTYSTSYVAQDPATYTLLAGTTRTQTAAVGVSVTATTGTTVIDIEGTLSGPAVTTATANTRARAINVANNVPSAQIMVGTAGIVETTNEDAFRSQSINGRVDLTNLGTIRSLNANAAPTFGGTNINTAFAVQYNAALGAAGAPATDYVSGGIITNGSTTVTNALIRSDSGDAIRLGSHQTLVNYGTINGNGPVNDSPDNNIYASNGNTSVATTYDNSRGVRINQNNATAVRVENYNTITGAQHGVDIGVAGATNIVIVNAANATITGRNGSGIGGDTTGVAANTVTVDNSGTITGAYAPAFDRAGYATIDGDGDGVDIDGGATIINRAGATIRGTGAGGFDSGGRANNSEGISIGGGSITNDGIIVGATRGIIVNNDSVASRSGVTATTIVNNATGTITGQAGFAIRLENKNGNATDNDSITNYGTITGNGTIPTPTDTVFLQNGTTADPNSVGTLDGVTYTGTGAARFVRGDGAAIQTGEGIDTIVNYGTITGNSGRAISLEGGDDTLNLFTGGSVTGRIDGGAGNDTLRLRLDDRAGMANSGSTTGTVTSAINFENLSVEGGTWTLTDAQTYAATSIAMGGILRVGAAGSLGTVTDAGTLIFAVAGPVTQSGSVTGAGVLVQSGTGVLTLSGANSYVGGTTIMSGTLDVVMTNSAGTGAITFAAGAQVLKLETTAFGADVDHSFANTVTGFAAGDAIDFGFARGSVALAYSATTNRIQLLSTASGATVASVQLSGSYAGQNFQLTDNGQGLARVTVTTPSPTPTPTPAPTPTPTPNPAIGTGSAVVVQNGVAYTQGSFTLAPGAAITALTPANQMSTDPINLTGNEIAQTIVGNYGNNVLTGAGAADTLIGLFGNDTYVVSDAGTVIVEQGDQGNDQVLTSVSYVLGAGVSVEALSVADQSATTPINLTGNSFAQTIAGNMGNNVIVGGGGADTLIGLGGNDTFLVTGQGEMVIEANGGGADLVYTTASYNLGANEVEALSTVQQTDTTPINLIGNYVSQIIVGNYGDNILNGGSGVDTLVGLFGNDTYVVGDSRIIIVEQAGQGTDTVLTSVDYTLAAGVSVESLVAQDRASTTGLALIGNEVAQTIGGTNGNDTINGGLGNDTLIGFGGADLFAFTTALGTTNVDTIVDLAPGTDRIGLGASIFASIGTTLDANEFVVGTAATTSTQFIVYNQATGQLFYDADGSGAGAAALFAQITPGTVLTPAAFTVV